MLALPHDAGRQPGPAAHAERAAPASPELEATGRRKRRRCRDALLLKYAASGIEDSP